MSKVCFVREALGSRNRFDRAIAMDEDLESALRQIFENLLAKVHVSFR